MTEIRRGPVAIDALDARIAELRDCGKQAGDDPGMGIVCIDQHRQRKRVLNIGKQVFHFIGQVNDIKCTAEPERSAAQFTLALP